VAALSTPPLSLYVHFPWCVRKCPYCDFNSYTLGGELPQVPYLARLTGDLGAQASQVGGRTVTSVFFGGGTPSLFSPASIGAVLDAARREVTLAEDAEVTLEANPGAIERGLFHEYRAAGVNRVSLGAQTFDEGTLHALGRIHSPAETRRAASELHAAGLANFNLDLMYALPGQDVAGALADIEAALELAPAHVSHYQLTLEPGTVFAARPPALPDEDAAAAMLAVCGERLAREGFAQYEVSAYALPGQRCRHNLNYWNFGDYLGIGAGAHGKLTFADRGEVIRTTHTREPRRYLAGVPLERRVVAACELPFEFLLNALRLIDGFGVGTFCEYTGLPWSAVAATVQTQAARGLLVATENGWRPSARGLRFLNELLVEFLPETSKNVEVSQASVARPEARAGN
jgi:putative oxygen-independent coproporphyrinogen III oxidase